MTHRIAAAITAVATIATIAAAAPTALAAHPRDKPTGSHHRPGHSHGTPDQNRHGHDGSVGGTITSISGSTVVIATTHHRLASSVTLDISSATIFGGDPATAESASSLAVGDRVSVKLSVSDDTAEADAAAGTAVPASAVYDGGPAPTPAPTPAPSPTPTPSPSPAPTHGPQVHGTVTAVSGAVVTIAAAYGATYTLDLDGVTLYAGQPLAPAPLSTIAVGDTMYARLAVDAATAAADATAGTPVPVVTAYDFAPGTAPTD